MWQSIANIILRNRFIIIGVLTLLTIFFGYNIISGLKLDNKYGILLPKNAESKKDYDRFKEMFGEDGGTLVIAIQTDSLYTETTFLKWKELGDSILRFDGVESVVSEATLYTITNNKEAKKFTAHPVFSDTKYQEKSIDSIEREIKNNPLYDRLLYNQKENVSLMMVGIDESYISDQEKASDAKLAPSIQSLGKEAWDQHTQTWQATIDDLIQDMQEGLIAAKPIDDEKTCQTCPVRSACQHPIHSAWSNHDPTPIKDNHPVG